jgi:hypothetical protein
MRRQGECGLSPTDVGERLFRLHNVKSLWFAVQNDPDVSVQDVAVEFFLAVGKVLEGKRLESLELRRIDKARVLQHAKEI